MMRLQQLALDRFGHFTDRVLDFGARPASGSDFHIVFGGNEAGKTTLMEGYLRLLYGFAAREPYAFKHPRANLRVSGTVDVDGQIHQLSRLPKRSGNLVDAAGQPVPDALLSAALRGVSQKEYQSLLCLDDETIEAGGEEITKSEGDIGKLLFSAAAGISDLSQVLGRVAQGNRDLYLKGGTKSEFAALKAAHAELVQQIKDHDVSAAAFRELRLARDAAQTEEQRLRAAKSELSVQKTRLEAILDAHPLATEWKTLEAQLTPIAHYPTTLEFDSEDLIKMMTKRIALVAERERSVAEVHTLRAARDEVAVNADDLARGADVDALAFKKSQVEAGQSDLPKREAQLKQDTADMRARLDALGLPADGALAQFILSDPALTALEQARATLDDARKHLQTTQAEAEVARDKYDDAARALRDTEEETAVDADVERLFMQAEAEDLVSRYNDALRRLAADRQGVATALRGLTRQNVAFDAVPALPLSSRRAQELMQAHGEARLALRAAVQAETTAADRLAGAETKHAMAASAPDLISDDAAAKGRQTRDELWALHKDVLDMASASAFEAAMRADDAQTSLRAGQSQSLAEMRQAERQLIEARQDHDRAQNKRTETEVAFDKVTGELRSHLDTLGLPETLSAEDFVEWVRDAEAAQTAAETLKTSEQAHTELLRAAEQMRDDLAARLEAGDAPLRTVVLMAKTQIAASREHQNAQKIAQATVRQATAERDRRAVAADKARTAVTEARDQWRGAVATHLPALQSGIDMWNGLTGLRSIREVDARMAGVRRQIAGIKQDRAGFIAQLDALDGGADAQEQPLARYAALQTAVERARQAQARRNDLDARLAMAEDAAAEALREIAVLDDQVQLLARAFDDQIDTSTLDALRRATATAQQAIALRQQSADLRTRLLSILGVDAWEQAQERLTAAPLAQAQVKLAELCEDLSRLEAELDSAIAARARAQAALDAVGGDGDIAALTSQKRTVEEQMQAVMLRYLTGRFGHTLAEDAIRRYRDTHRSTMLAATEQAFSDLTQGAYTTLTTQPAAQGDVLMAVRAEDGVSKEAAAMSKGTRFQLYLALRAAAYEQMASTGTVLPFFCDDVFETFDEDRTRAACRLMQRVGKRGQAIYLTHHQHVVDLAQEACGTDVTVHRL